MHQFTPQQPRPKRGCSPFALLGSLLWVLPSIYVLDIAIHVGEHGANGVLLGVGVAGAIAGLAPPCLMRRLLAQALSGEHRRTEDGTILVGGDVMSSMLQRIYFIIGLILAIVVLNTVTYTFLDVQPRIYVWVFVQVGLLPAEFADW